jgi:putative nucleotidyltransferase with HDIG domain
MKKLLSAIRNNYSNIYKGSLFLLTMVILVMLFPKNKQFRYEFEVGRPWLYEDLQAPKDFPIIKSQKDLNQEIEKIKSSSKLYFYYDVEHTQSETNRINASFDTLWLRKYGFGKREAFMQNKAACMGISNEILETGLVEIPEELSNENKDKVVYIVRNKIAKETFLNYFYTKKTAYKYFQEKLSNNSELENVFIANFLSNNLTANVFFDSLKTASEQQNLLSHLSPNVGVVLKGQHIISKGEIVTNDVYKVLESLKSDFETDSRKSSLNLYIGKIILISIPLITLGLFLMFFRPDVFEDNKNLIMIFILLIFMTAITRLMLEYQSAYVLMIPLMISPIIIRAFYDSRLALIVHIITVILISFVVPSSFQFIFLQLMTGLITIISIVKLQNRAQFFLTSFYIFASYSIIYIGMELITEATLVNISWKPFLYFAISAGLSLLAYPIIYVFERLFGMVTDVSLLEYADTNNQLIRKLATQAPGTFHHCIQVSNLAEAAAVEIGANALLVRAGAMYHDIGKMLNPMYFTENQSGNYSPHEELSYEESAEIIIGHVLEGVKLAKENHLPEQIIDFIRTHHGTKRVEYFYRMSKIENPNEEIKLSDFTYHGPIPYSKETSLLMMADAVEAASRSLKNPNAKSISELVDKIVGSQLEQGQFNNANISLREINTAKKVLKRKLLNIYHLRIEYPEE